MALIGLGSFLNVIAPQVSDLVGFDSPVIQWRVRSCQLFDIDLLYLGKR